MRLSAGIAVLVVRLALAGLFAFSGVVKLNDPQAFAFSVKAFEILPDHLAVLATFAIPWTELLCAACLLLGLWTRAAAVILALTLAIFIAGIASVLSRGLSVNCGCFGGFKLACTGPLGLCNILQNSVLLLAALAVAALGHGRLGIDGLCAGLETPPPRP